MTRNGDEKLPCAVEKLVHVRGEWPGVSISLMVMIISELSRVSARRGG
jgi:hypothetical protein